VTDHRQLGVDAFNHVWTLMDKPDRTREEDDQMLHEAHASTYHWLKAPECRPENRARGEWICSRMYTVLGRAEPALYHARRCLEFCEKHRIGDWDLAFAHEALARAHALAGQIEDARRHETRARELGAEIEEEDDREHLFEALEALPR
jgi:predicted ATPase